MLGGWGVLGKVGYGCLQKLRVILEFAEASVTGGAQKGSDLACNMVVVDR